MTPSAFPFREWRVRGFNASSFFCLRVANETELGLLGMKETLTSRTVRGVARETTLLCCEGFMGKSDLFALRSMAVEAEFVRSLP